jgi:hypothetical protein
MLGGQGDEGPVLDSEGVASTTSGPWGGGEGAGGRRRVGVARYPPSNDRATLFKNGFQLILSHYTSFLHSLPCIILALFFFVIVIDFLSYV